MHSNSPPQELILTLPPSFTRSRTDPRPRRGSVVVCREFPTASSNKVGTKLGGGGEGGWRRPGSWRSKINPAITPPTPLSLSFSRCPLDPPFLRFCFSTHLLVFIVATRSPHSRRFISLFPNPFSVPPPFLSLKYSNNSRERRGGEVSFGFCGGLVEIRKKRRYRWNFGEIRIGGMRVERRRDRNFSTLLVPSQVDQPRVKNLLLVLYENPTWRWIFSFAALSDRSNPLLELLIQKYGSKFVFVDVWKFLFLLIGFSLEANFLR